jgi:hypothetical protein
MTHLVAQTAAGQGPAPPAADWHARADDLADWTRERLVNRTDVWGAYCPEPGMIRTAPRKRDRGRARLSRDTLLIHFSADCREHVIGLHTTAPDNTSLWGALEFDNHDHSTAQADANRKAALAGYNKLHSDGWHPLLTDCNGEGSFHLRVLFDSPQNTARVYSFLQALAAELAFEHKLDKVPETFPKQPAVSAPGEPGEFGNWLRVPGRHHTRDFWSPVWDGEHWLTGNEAIDFITDLAGDPGALLPQVTPRQDTTSSNGATSGTAPDNFPPAGRERVLSALNALKPERADDYDARSGGSGRAWLDVGMILHSWDPVGGLELWEQWSRKSGKFKDGECAEKWRSFRADGGLKVGTLFHMAKEDGWQDPGAAPEANGKDMTEDNPDGPEAPPETATGEKGDANLPWSGHPRPPSYSITDAGLVREKVGENKDGTPRMKTLSDSPIWVEALARTHRGEQWGALLTWRDPDGKTHRAAFPASRFHEQGHSLIQELADAGLAVVPTREAALRRYLGRTARLVKQRRRSVSRLGWCDDSTKPLFVLADSFIGEAGDEQPVYQPSYHSADRPRPAAAGTLQEWQQHVAARARGNPFLVFTLSTSFAGPLLGPGRAESGGFHIFGASSKGKTTTAQTAASVWGSGADPNTAPAESFIRTWNSTTNATEGLAADHCDSLLVLDEIGTANVPDMGRLIYQLAGGLGKVRMDRDAKLRTPRSWRLLLLSTGEVGIQHIIEAEGRRARGGQLVRMVDIPATGKDKISKDPDGKGQLVDGGIIHDPHGLDPASFVHATKRACATYYGTAGPAFIAWLCGQGSNAELARRVQRDLERAHKDMTPPGAAEEVSRVIRRFALVRVAGHLACDAGILPFTRQEVSAAVKLVMARWLDVHGTGPMERAAEQLRAFLLEKEANFRPTSEGDHDPRVPTNLGYRDRSAGLFLLLPKAAREALDGFAVDDVMKYLQAQGLLVPGGDGRPSSSRWVSGINRTVRVYAIRTELLGGKDPDAAEDGDDE